MRLPEGIIVGHWTDEVGRTGCTVVLAPDGAGSGGDERGAAAAAVGAGTGATVAKAGDRSQVRPGGVGIASAEVEGATVAAVMVSNSVGGIWDDERHEWVAPLTAWDRTEQLFPAANTAIGVVMTDAALTKEQANRLATVAHDGIARAIRPAHTMYDGDVLFCLATGAVDAPYDAVEVLSAQLVARAVVHGVRAAHAGRQAD